MIYLVGSIVLTSWLTLAFKVVQRWRVDPFQAIVFNYIFCTLTGCIVNGNMLQYDEVVQRPWFSWAFLMGTVFISLFHCIGVATRRLGVAVASVANKLSLVIPFVFSVVLYNETPTWLKIAGIAVALVAVVLTCLPQTKGQAASPQTGRENWVYFFPVIIFIGSGLLDTMIKYVEQAFLNDNNKNEYLISAFSVAAVIGVLILAIRYATGTAVFSPKALLAGIMIGVPNYFSIWCLVQVLKIHANNSSAIIPINNMGIVLFSAVMAWLFFRERLSGVNWMGIILAVAAIALIAYG